ncbi:hypothetical protein M6B38_250770 [Iris pallida]|uniref:Secreted peptide n=1 Tax=Iris pallida TaxID=29817 RepID=A0AAX6IK68_IRIPA|nr:hypothetical protein M6B38_250770 [Iris pallida]
MSFMCSLFCLLGVACITISCFWSLSFRIQTWLRFLLLLCCLDCACRVCYKFDTMQHGHGFVLWSVCAFMILCNMV